MLTSFLLLYGVTRPQWVKEISLYLVNEVCYGICHISGVCNGPSIMEFMANIHMFTSSVHSRDLSLNFYLLSDLVEFCHFFETCLQPQCSPGILGLSLCPSVFQWLFVPSNKSVNMPQCTTVIMLFTMPQCAPLIMFVTMASMYSSDYVCDHTRRVLQWLCLWPYPQGTPVIMFVTIPHCTQMNMFVTMPPVYSSDYVCHCGPSILQWLCLSLWLQYTPVIMFVTMASVYSSDYVCHYGFSILQWLCLSLWPQYTAVIMFVTMASVYSSDYVCHYGFSILQ